MNRDLLTFAAAAAALLALSGCNSIDPLKRPYMWKESGANQQNIAAMAANPADLYRGRDTPKRKVSVESDSIEHFWNGKPTPMISAGAPGTSGGSSAGSSSSGSGGATPGGS
jgi:type IV pilus biogenesis protein CpaD/CtpE